MARYLDIEQMVKRELRDAERVYVNGILQNGLESGNNKPFWKYVKSQKQESFCISALKSNSLFQGKIQQVLGGSPLLLLLCHSHMTSLFAQFQ